MAIQHLFQHALNEDAPTSDITSDWLLDSNTQATAQAVIKSPGIFFASPVINDCLHAMPSIAIEQCIPDGAPVSPNDIALRLQGGLQDILHIERTLLNFIQRLSGIATITHQFVTALNDPSIQVLDTRKTIPGLRIAQKYAVKCGGGSNHRIGLFDAFLLKENHIVAAGSIGGAIEAAKTAFPDKPVEIEVENLEELAEAMAAGADIALIDNFSIADTQTAVAISRGKIVLEASGGITQDSIAEIARTGVDYISCGDLTKGVEPLDLSMRFVLDQ